MADVKSLLADPEFQSLSTSGKRDVLSSFDPDFSGLTDEGIVEFVSVPSEPAVINPFLRRGGAGKPLNPETAKQIAARRLVEREKAAGMAPDLVLTPSGGVGVAGGGLGGQITAGARGLAQGLTFGVSEPVLEASIKGLLASGLTTPEAVSQIGSIDRQNPLAKEVGLDLSFVAPTGAAKTVAGVAKAPATATLGTKIAQILKASGAGGLAAGTFGSSSETARQLRADEELSPSAIAEAGARAVPVGLGLGALSGTLASAKRNPLNQLADVLQPSGQKEQARWVASRESGSALKAVQIVRQEGKPKDLLGFQKNADKAEGTIGKAIDEIVEIDPLAEISTAPILQRAASEAEAFPLGNNANEIVSYAKANFSKPLTLKEAIKVQRQLNKELLTQLKDADWNETAAEASPLYVARNAARAELSKAIDAEMKRLTGTDSNPYRDWGSVHELNVQLQKRYNRLRTQADVSSGRGPVGELLSTSEAGTNLPGKGRIIQKVVGTVTGAELGRINRQVKNLMDKIPAGRPIPTEPGPGVEEGAIQRQIDAQAKIDAQRAELEALIERFRAQEATRYQGFPTLQEFIQNSLQSRQQP